MKRILLITAAVMSIASSCNKVIDVGPPRTDIDRSKVFSDDASATAAAVGLYARLTAVSGTFLNGAMPRFMGQYGDELEATTSSSDNDVFARNSLPADNSTVLQTFWNAGYNYIFHANAVLEGLSSSAAISQATKDQLRGEMLVLRALIYSYQVGLFSDVPLVLSTDLKEIELMPRTNEGRVWDQITADLSEAKRLLSPAYPVAGKIRANKWAATALLARIHLYRGNWELANKEAGELIDAGAYSLGPLENTFLAGNNEAILQIVTSPTSSIVTGDGGIFLPTSANARPAYALSATLKAAFEAGDKRLEKWTGKNTVAGTAYTYPAKYKVRSVTAGTARPEQITVLRLAEQLLIRAEARAQLGLLADAISDLDAIRSRAGLPRIADAPTAPDKEQLLELIYRERRIELFAEYGHRWFDLKRTGKLDAVIGSLKTTWKQTAALLPIPLSQIRVNPSLTQNQGYTN